MSWWDTGSVRPAGILPCVHFGARCTQLTSQARGATAAHTPWSPGGNEGQDGIAQPRWPSSVCPLGAGTCARPRCHWHSLPETAVQS